MSAGTLTLTNNSAAVSGSGTPFNTELAAGDFIVVTVGGVPYTLPVKSVESATALTLVSVYTGPTQSGAAWSAVPRVALNMVTAALVAQSAEALRGLNYDKQNWQQLFSGTGTITVRLPDGTTYTGPAWNSITKAIDNKADKTALDNKADKTALDNKADKTALDNKADKTALDSYAKKGANADITSISGLTTALSLAQGGTGLTNPFGISANTFCQGNDTRLGTVNNKSGGEISSPITVRGTGITGKINIIGADYTTTQGSGIYSVSRTNNDRFDHYLGGAAVGQPFSLLWALRPGGADPGSLYWGMVSSGDMTTPKGTVMTSGSDVRLKNNLTPVINTDEAGNRLDKIGIVEYQWKYGTRTCRGMLAQQMDGIDPLYTFTEGKASDDDGKEFEVLNVDQTAVVADLVLVVQSLRKRVQELEANQKMS
ncbi:tail fiber domain-containing protein [Cedecea sp. P7760]|uniref:tail fiber domain-containing protein n=1 Tax=Cedecea sp. P7760 TaxID=2726983 RepID=UPI0015A203EB|nr:tail fiber domain-containing protein [Cedecea sp. P7760]NWC63766.1 tail fiber domain-containing protein [Cedecea sp. P7760]